MFLKQILVENCGSKLVSPKTSKYSEARSTISQESFAPTGSKGYALDGSVEKEPTTERSEHNSPPGLDDAKMDKFTYKQPIISFIKGLNNEDTSGKMVPTRDCLQPKFGVRYYEPDDESRKVKSITLVGQSFY